MSAEDAILYTEAALNWRLTNTDKIPSSSYIENMNSDLYNHIYNVADSLTLPDLGVGVCVEVVVVGATLDGLITATPNNLDSYLTQTVIEELSNGDATVSDHLTMVKNGQKSMTVVEFPNSSTTRSGFLIGDNGSTLSIENSDLQLVVNK